MILRRFTYCHRLSQVPGDTDDDDSNAEDNANTSGAAVNSDSDTDSDGETEDKTVRPSTVKLSVKMEKVAEICADFSKSIADFAAETTRRTLADTAIAQEVDEPLSVEQVDPLPVEVAQLVPPSSASVLALPTISVVKDVVEVVMHTASVDDEMGTQVPMELDIDYSRLSSTSIAQLTRPKRKINSRVRLSPEPFGKKTNK